MKRANLVIGTRGSKLAMIYAENVKKELKKYYSKEIQLKKIVTTGDQKHDERLSEIGGKGLFSKQIEKDLLNKNLLSIPRFQLLAYLLKHELLYLFYD